MEAWLDRKIITKFQRPCLFTYTCRYRKDKDWSIFSDSAMVGKASGESISDSLVLAEVVHIERRLNLSDLR